MQYHIILQLCSGGAIRLDLSELLKSAKNVKDILSSSSIVLGLCNVIKPCLQCFAKSIFNTDWHSLEFLPDCKFFCC